MQLWQSGDIDCWRRKQASSATPATVNLATQVQRVHSPGASAGISDEAEVDETIEAAEERRWRRTYDATMEQAEKVLEDIALKG